MTEVIASAPRRARRGLGRVLVALRLLRPLAVLRRRWRSSLQARVVAATVVLGLAVVLAVGNFLYQRIADGLVESRRDAVQDDARRLVGETQQRLDYLDKLDPDDMQLQLNQEAQTLQGPVEDRIRAVLLQVAQSNTEPERLSQARFGSPGISPAVIPNDLRTAVNTNPRQQQTKLATLPIDEGGTTRAVRTIVVGSIVNVPRYGSYELYLIYRLDREQVNIDLVGRTLLIGGLALVLLVAGVAVVVTRQVVAPVRQAVRTAEELASGRLDRRMRVRGEDDLARLGRAFNEMAASLERQIHQLEELSRVQRRFVSDVSHELRTPLTTIRMAGEVIHEARTGFDPAVSRSAELLATQLDRFEALLVDLLEVSRFDAGAAVLELEPADLREIAARVIEGLAPLAERRGSELRVHSQRLPCLADVDARRVSRVVRNLVGNAIEHGEGRPIVISVAGDANAVALSVRDYGVGLKRDQLGLVFNRFWRADPARARTTGGTGLGLAISLEDARLHGGWLEVWARPGAGACFRLTLPRHGGTTLVGSPLPLRPADRERPPRPLTGGGAADAAGSPARAGADG